MADPGRIDGLIAAVPQAMALRAGLELGLFTRLGGDAMSAGELGAALGVDADRLARLLYALASIDFLEVEDGLFSNSAEAAAFLEEKLAAQGV